jgi:CDP-diacylglycerol--serine O-phosphatidyltransferase
MKFKDYLTLLNGLSGFFGIVLALQHNELAFLYIAPALIFDFLDGRFARSSKSDVFGKEFDSVSDVVSFIIAPVVLILAFGFNAFVFIASAFYVCCGLVRLARFNIQKEKGVFFGLPSPAAALIVLAVFLLNSTLLTIVALLVIGFLMVSSFKIKKI